MTLNQKTIDAIKKAKHLVVVRRELQTEFDRVWSKAKRETPLPPGYQTLPRSCYEAPPSAGPIEQRMIRVDQDLRQLQRTILIHLEVVKD